MKLLSTTERGIGQETVKTFKIRLADNLKEAHFLYPTDQEPRNQFRHLQAVHNNTQVGGLRHEDSIARGGN